MPKRLKLDGYIAQRAFNTPLLLEAGKARTISSYLESRINGNFPADSEFFDEDEVRAGYIGGVAIIPIIGTLVNRSGFMEAESGILSHRGIRDEIVKAANDPQVKTILLDIDSGGGEVEGNFDLGRLIRRINDEYKPVVAIANGSAFSGAYSLGVSAGSFFMTETGGVGSVGVIIQHIDYSQFNEEVGINVTQITYGDRKGELSSDFPLSDSARQMLEDEASRVGKIFVDHVAKMRNIQKETVINTQAGLVFGEEAVNIGFVDGIVSFDQLLETLVNSDFPVGPIEKQRMTQMFLDKDKSKKIEGDDPKKSETPEHDPEKVEVPSEEPAPEKTNEDEPEAPSNEEVDPVERAASISEICAEAGLQDMAPSFIRSSMTVDEIKGKVDLNDQIRKACKLAGKSDRAESFIKANKTLKQVQDELVREMSNDQEDVDPNPDPDTEKANLEAAKNSNVILADVEKRKQAQEAKLKKGSE